MLARVSTRTKRAAVPYPWTRPRRAGFATIHRRTWRPAKCRSAASFSRSIPTVRKRSRTVRSLLTSRGRVFGGGAQGCSARPPWQRAQPILDLRSKSVLRRKSPVIHGHKIAGRWSSMTSRPQQRSDLVQGTLDMLFPSYALIRGGAWGPDRLGRITPSSRWKGRTSFQPVLALMASQSKREHRLIEVAPTPLLSKFNGAHQWMAGRMKVF